MEVDFTLHHPASIILCGPTQSGKTVFAFNLIARRHEITSHRLEKVIYGEYQDKFKAFAEKHKDVTFTNDINSLQKLAGRDCLIVLDDLLLDFLGKKNSMITEIFIRGCHHRRQSFILILQVENI